MKVLVCGSRSWTDGTRVRTRLAELPKDTVILHGGAKGADIDAYWAALDLGLTAYSFLPDWKRDGKKAGILRNLRMLDERPDLVLAFWDGQSRGTKHTIDEARRRGIPVELVPAGEKAA